MDAAGLLIYQHVVRRVMQVFQDEIEVGHKLGLWYEFDPLDENVHISPLEQDVVPLALLNHVQHKTHIILLLLGCLVVLLNLAQHANY